MTYTQIVITCNECSKDTHIRESKWNGELKCFHCGSDNVGYDEVELNDTK